MNEWADIVGHDIAMRCRPKKLDRPRPGQSGEGVLTLRVEAGFALEVQHLAPILIERINGYFGFRAVHRLRLLQAPLTAQVTPSAAADDDPAPGPDMQDDPRLAAIPDSEVRDALARLARAVRTRRR
ncbi:MAG: DUF721 domain-containing protein [Alphaproteobacteria bacterium]|nr:MAG: DUF721 domain-containing protein [Alphaproteobacteria bacterium]